MAEVECGRVGCFENGFAVGAGAENDFSGFASEIGGEDITHAGVGTHPAGAVELGAESLGAAALAVVEGVEFDGVEWRGRNLPDPDVDVAGRESPRGVGRIDRRVGGILHVPIAPRSGGLAGARRGGETIEVTKKGSLGTREAYGGLPSAEG